MNRYKVFLETVAPMKMNPGRNFALFFSPHTTLKKPTPSYDTPGDIFFRTDQPCWGGELRPYGPDSSRPDDPRPGDLKDPFPLDRGNPSALILFNMAPDKEDKLCLDIFKFITETSHKRGFPKVGPRVVSNNLLLENLNDVEPTTLVSSYKILSELIKPKTKYEHWEDMKKLGDKCGWDRPEYYAFFLFSFCRHNPYENSDWSFYVDPCGYKCQVDIDPRRFFTGDIREDLIGGSLFEKSAYNRPDIASLFSFRKDDNDRTQTVSNILKDTKGNPNIVFERIKDVVDEYL